MKKCLILLALLSLVLAPAKAQFSQVYFSNYCDRTLNADSLTWGEWSQWISSEGDIQKYDEFFIITYSDEAYFIEINDEDDAVTDAQGYFHRIFNCIDDDGYDCKIDVVIDPLDAKIIQCQIWYEETAKAFDITSEE